MSSWYRAIGPLARAWSRFFTFMYPAGFGLLLGHAYLLLETRGRRTGLRRVTPLGYVPWRGGLLVQPLHGPGSAWLRNLLACPEVGVVVGRRRLRCIARVIDDMGERHLALRAIAASRTLSGLTARKHFSLLAQVSGAGLEQASRDLAKPLVVLERAPPNELKRGAPRQP